MNQANQADLRKAARELEALLEIAPGVTALIGSGGKTTLMETLAAALTGTVILCTTTRIFRPAAFPVLAGADEAAVGTALARHRAVCVGEDAPEGKLSAPGIPLSRLALLADYVLVEADGARGLPLKAHAPWEPAVPEDAGQAVLVAGLSGLGRPVRAACHRPERYAALGGISLDAAVTPAAAARVIAAEGYGTRLFLNQAEDALSWGRGEAVARLLPLPAVCGSLRRGVFHRLR